jgi:hypothetical protein
MLRSQSAQRSIVNFCRLFISWLSPSSLFPSLCLSIDFLQRKPGQPILLFPWAGSALDGRGGAPGGPGRAGEGFCERTPVNGTETPSRKSDKARPTSLMVGGMAGRTNSVQRIQSSVEMENLFIIRFRHDRPELGRSPEPNIMRGT